MDKLINYFKTQFPSGNVGNDIFAGIMVALVSIPISMGYAQVAGLAPVYGLYGSLLPILVYGLISSSKQFVVGVDAMPAAMVGVTLAQIGVLNDAEAAARVVPVISLLVALWFLILWAVRAGRVVKYISDAVMGGFISGVGLTIILMITPKLLGGGGGTGELPALVMHIIGEWPKYNILSALLGIGTIVLIQIGKRLCPKLPLSVILLVCGGLLGYFLPLDTLGVATLPQTQAGLPGLHFPDLTVLAGHWQDLLVDSLMIALVIMAQTLLASNTYAQKYDFTINNGRELLAYSAMNVAGAAVGICPINGSVSRSGLADGFGARSHIMSITSAVCIGFILLFGTPLLEFLPVPVLTGIVFCALLGILNLKQAKRLREVNHTEFMIFVMAMLGVLFLGTIYGVVIGIVLSFFEVIRRAVLPPRAFLGQIPGHGDEFYNLKRNKGAHPIQNTVIYRFGGNLFFANIQTFEDDIREAITDDTKQVIVDARGIGNIDITASDRLLAMYKKLRAKGIGFYLVEHGGQLNDQLRRYGAGEMIRHGAVRRTTSLALRACGVNKPYPLEGFEGDGTIPTQGSFVEAGERLAEFEWAFGDDTEEVMEQLAGEIAVHMLELFDANDETALFEQLEENTTWGKVGLFDEDELLDYLEIKLDQMEHLSSEKQSRLREMIENRRNHIEKKLERLNPKAEELLHDHRLKLAQHMREKHPEEYRRILDWENRHNHS